MAACGRRRRTRVAGGAALVVALLVVCGAQTASAAIYRWVDDRGITHFSDRPEDVPPAFRDQIRDLTPELEASSPVNVLPGLHGAAEGEAAETPSAPPKVDPFQARRMLDQMAGPMKLVAVVAGLVAMGLGCALLALALLVGCRMVGQESPGFRKAYGIVLVQSIAGLLVGPGVIVVAGGPDVSSLGGLLRLQMIQLGVFLVVNAAVLRAMLCDGFGRALGLAVVMNLVLLLFGFAFIVFAVCAGGFASVTAG